MKHKRLAVVALVGAAASASAANAQLAPNQMAQGRVARSVQINASAAVQYDSNVARTSDTLAAQEGIRPEDTTYTPSINANMVLPVGRQALFLSGVVGYTGHQYNTQLDNTHADLTGGAGASVGPCGGVLTGGYSRGQSEYGNTLITSNVKDIQEVKKVDLGVACVRKAGLGVFVDGSRSWSSNSIPLTANGSYVSTLVTGGVSYQRPSFGSISLTASDAKTDYSKDGIAAMLIGSSGFESKAVGVSLERKLGGRIQATAAVSYTKSTAEQAVPVGATIPAAGNFSGLTYSGDVSFRASSRLQAHAGFNRSVNPSQITGGSFEVDTEYQVGVSYSLGSRIKLAMTGRDRQTLVHGAIPIAFAATTLTDARSKSVDVSAEYRLNKRVSFVLTARHETRDANNAALAYDDDGVGLSTAVRF
jgi:hypothetical protein